MLMKSVLLGAALGMLLIGAAPARADGGTVLAPKPNFSLGYAGLAELKFAPGGGTTTLKSIETIVIARGIETGGLYPDTQEGDVTSEKFWAIPGGGDGVASGPKFAPGGGTGTVSPGGGTKV